MLHIIDIAMQISTHSHSGQTDKAGQPYILHVMRVMNKMDNDNEKVVAMLHDVVEDTDVTLTYLYLKGIQGEVLDSIDTLTRLNDNSYSEYIKRILTDKTACKVKLADLEDNMNILRLKKPNKEYFNMLKKYHKAWNVITNHLNKG